VSRSGGHKRTGKLNRRLAELEQLSKDDLINLVLELEGHILPSTDPFQQPNATRPFDLDLSWEPREYIRVPEGEAAQLETPWRLIFISFDLAHPILGLDVYGDTIIGRARSGDDDLPNLDLSDYNALAYGVSRRHLLLHPTVEELRITDLDSTNGTRLNGEWIKPMVPYALSNNDTVALGGLLFQIRITTWPGSQDNPP
jgi:hypothetical protein